MSEYILIPIKWAGARTISIGAGAATVSDAFLFSGNAIGGIGTFKADNAGVPASGDTVDVYILGSAGDPDGAGVNELASADATHGNYLTTLDTNVTDPALRTPSVPAYVEGKIRAVNNGASAVTFSGIIKELIG
jgi:hypothetical protein